MSNAWAWAGWIVAGLLVLIGWFLLGELVGGTGTAFGYYERESWLRRVIRAMLGWR